MQTGRSKLDDRALCLHEAAHAVTCEVLRPGSVIGIEMDYVPGTTTLGGDVFGDATQAVCTWNVWSYGDIKCLTAIAAGREGEKIDENYSDQWRFDGGDMALLRSVAPPWSRRRARRMAESLVRKHELAIRRVAKALAEKRVMTGDEIRAVMA